MKISMTASLFFLLAGSWAASGADTPAASGLVERIAPPFESAPVPQTPEQPGPVTPPPAAVAPEAAPVPSPVFASRFSLPPTDASAAFPPWLPADCGCAPDTSLQAYVFFPIGGQAAPAKVNFEVATRIAYFSLSPNAVGDIVIPEAWDAAAYTRVAHRYAAKVDLAISKDKWCSETSAHDCAADAVQLDKSYVLQNLVDEIADAATAVGADGVTIDFAKIPPELHNAYHFFIKRLSKRLRQDGHEYQLNVVIHDLAELDTLFAGKKAKDGSGDSEEAVDLFLIAWPGHGAQAGTINQLNNAFWKSGIPMKKAFVVLDATDKQFAEKYALILRRDFGGVGVWALGQGKGGWEASLAADLVRSTQQQNSDYVKQLLQNVLPAGFCKMICPNRDAISMALAVVAGVYVAFLLLSLVVFEWRDILNKYFPYVLLIGVGIALVFFSIVLCVPFWRSYQTEITAALAAILIGYWVKSFRDKKREMNYP